jgi:ABC-type phosphate/phosphonate transport system substrate-binding protein
MENSNVNTNQETFIVLNTELIPNTTITTTRDVVQEAIDKLVSQLNEINKPQTEN